MARRIIKKEKGPFEIKPQEKSAWICMCGLSKTQPYCDGSHKAAQDEDDAVVYEYDKDGRRTVVT